MNESSSLTNTDGEKFRHALVHAPHFTSQTTLEFQAPGDRKVFHLHFKDLAWRIHAVTISPSSPAS